MSVGYVTYMSSPLAGSSTSSAPPSSPVPSSVGFALAGSRSNASHVHGASRRRHATSVLNSTRHHMLQPGLLSLGSGSGGRSSNNNISEGAGGDVTLARLRRQQFRQKCQEAMARDRNRDRDKKISAGRQGQERSGSPGSDNESERQQLVVLHSDDLSSSDLDDDAHQEREMELARHMLAVDYRKMLRELERSGQREVGWLDPDEVAWLEEEIQREEALNKQQGLEPPADLLDEDEELYAQYWHAQQGDQKGEADPVDDFSWIDDDELQREVERVELSAAPSRAVEDTVMSET